MKIKEVKFDKSEGVNTKMFIFISQETILDNLQNRNDRPYKMYKEVLIPQIKDILKEKGVDIEGMKISWSQYAGCSCGCSPGFVLKGATNMGVLDIFVDVE